MYHRFIPAVCEACRQPVPRAAAGRCPSCRTEFATTGTTRSGARRHGLRVRPSQDTKNRVNPARSQRSLP